MLRKWKALQKQKWISYSNKNKTCLVKKKKKKLHFIYLLMLVKLNLNEFLKKSSIRRKANKIFEVLHTNMRQV